MDRKETVRSQGRASVPPHASAPAAPSNPTALSRQRTSSDLRNVTAGGLRATTAAELRAVTATDLRDTTGESAETGPDEAALRGDVLPLGNSVLEDIQGTFG